MARCIITQLVPNLCTGDRVVLFEHVEIMPQNFNKQTHAVRMDLLNILHISAKNETQNKLKCIGVPGDGDAQACVVKRLKVALLHKVIKHITRELNCVIRFRAWEGHTKCKKPDVTYLNSTNPWCRSRAMKSPAMSSRSPVRSKIPSQASGRNSSSNCTCLYAARSAGNASQPWPVNRGDLISTSETEQ